MKREREGSGTSRASGFADAPRAMLGEPVSAFDPERVRTILEMARSTGLLDGKTARVSGRISPALLDQAKQRSGIMSDTDLIEFALANLALDDDFIAVFRRVEGTVDADIPLGY